MLKPESSNSVVSSELVLYSLIINQLKHHLHTNFSLCSCLSFNVTFSGGALGSFPPAERPIKSRHPGVSLLTSLVVPSRAFPLCPCASRWWGECELSVARLHPELRPFSHLTWSPVSVFLLGKSRSPPRLAFQYTYVLFYCCPPQWVFELYFPTGSWLVKLYSVDCSEMRSAVEFICGYPFWHAVNNKGLVPDGAWKFKLIRWHCALRYAQPHINTRTHLRGLLTKASNTLSS